MGTSPLAAPVVLDLGERHLKVTKDGFKPFEKTVPIGGAADVSIAVPLEHEVHEAKVVIDAPAGAAILIDGAQVGVGKVELSLPAGGHQLRVTAPGMRTYQTDLALADKESRSMSVVLETEAPAVKPTLRVAVGCGDSAPKGPADGLVVYLDGPDVLPPTIVKQTWNPDLGQNVVDHVEYTLNAGKHTVRAALLGCYGYDVQVDVDPVKGADLSGALETSRGTLVRGPQGTPGWFQAGVGLWLAGGSVKTSVPDHYASRGISVVGETAHVGLVDRWFGWYVDFGYGAPARSTRTTFDSHPGLLPDSVGVKWMRLDTRFGPRFPFNVVSLGFGPKVGWEKVDLTGVRTDTSQGFGGGYFEVAFEPICDWGAFLNLSVDKPFNNDDASEQRAVRLHLGAEPLVPPRARHQLRTEAAGEVSGRGSGRRARGPVTARA